MESKRVVIVLEHRGGRLWADKPFTVDKIVTALKKVVNRIGKPRSIRVDNGPWFISKSLDCWANFHGIKLYFSRPDKPNDTFIASGTEIPSRSQY
jgi:hypothetical protein